MALAGAGAGGVIGYSSVDPEFRKMVEESIPGSDQVLDLVIGEKITPKPPKLLPPAPSKLKISSPVVITKPKEDSAPALAPMSVPPPPIEPPKPIVSAPVKEEKVEDKHAEPIKIDVKASEPVKVDVKASEPEKVEEKPAEPVKVEEKPAEPVLFEKAAESVKVEEKPEKPVKVDDKPAELRVEEKSAEPVKVEDEPPELVKVEEVKTDRVEQPAQEIVADTTTTEEPELIKEDLGRHDIENSSLELMLGELCQEMQNVITLTVEDINVAAKAAASHISLMEKVLESNVSAKDDTAWNEMFLAAKTKSEKNKTAETSMNKAKMAISNVLDSVAAGRKNKITATNPTLIAAEEAANKAMYNLDQAKVKRASVETEAKIMEEYRDLIEASKEEFQKEMASIMPDVRIGEKNGKLTEEELNMFITHAYKKVMFLQQELAKVTTIEQERFRKALEKQRLETTSLAVDQLDTELEKQARELGVEHERKLAAIREEAEAELRVQMKRQAAAHADHITDVLGVQEAEISRKYNKEIQETVDTLNGKYNSSLASLAGIVGGLKGGLEARAGADESSFAAQSLWVASNKLSSVVNSGNVQADSWEAKLAPLGGAVEAVKSFAGSEDKFVSALCSSISEVALERGVYTEDGLKHRFCQVETTARRVAGVGDQGGSLVEYGLSYLQSLLLVDLSKRAPVESLEVVDLETISSYDLLSLAKHNLDRGDLAKAVQLLTQLRGESGRVVSDWLTEARLTLETKQAVSAIQAHSLVRSCNNMIAN